MTSWSSRADPGPGADAPTGADGLDPAIHETTQWTTSVCTGSLLLGGAGLLDGLDATTHWSATELLESFGARYTEERVVVRGKVITAAGVSAGIDMGLTLAGLIAGDGRGQGHPAGHRVRPPAAVRRGSVAKAGPDVVNLVRTVLANESTDRAAAERHRRRRAGERPTRANDTHLPGAIAVEGRVSGQESERSQPRITRSH